MEEALDDSLTETADGTVLYNIACLSCRNAHRKCDRHYPVCNKCRDRSECHWPKIVKRRRKRQEQETNLVVYMNNNSSIQSLSNSTNQVECLSLIQYIYFQNMLFISPTFSSQELDELISCQFQNEPIANRGKLAALFALECYVLQRIGLSNECTSLFEACQFLINKVWFSDEQAQDDMEYCIQAVSVLGLYCLGHGFVNVAEKYSRMLKPHHQSNNEQVLFYIYVLEFCVELHKCLFVREIIDLDPLVNQKLVQYFEKKMNLETPCTTFSSFLYELDNHVEKMYHHKNQVANMKLLIKLLLQHSIQNVEQVHQQLPLFPYFTARLLQGYEEYKDVVQEFRRRYAMVEQFFGGKLTSLN